MGKCTTCRKADETYTRWERFRRFFFYFFTEDIQDLAGDQFTKGFGRGYEAGWQHADEFKQKYLQLYDRHVGLQTVDVVPETPTRESDTKLFSSGSSERA